MGTNSRYGFLQWAAFLPIYPGVTQTWASVFRDKVKILVFSLLQHPAVVFVWVGRGEVTVSFPPPQLLSYSFFSQQ